MMTTMGLQARFIRLFVLPTAREELYVFPGAAARDVIYLFIFFFGVNYEVILGIHVVVFVQSHVYTYSTRNIVQAK